MVFKSKTKQKGHQDAEIKLIVSLRETIGQKRLIKLILIFSKGSKPSVNFIENLKYSRAIVGSNSVDLCSAKR